MSPDSFLIPELSPQCCDAGSYPPMGDACARIGACYGDLRPGGVYYWFSLPTRLGLPDEILVSINLLLLLLSSLLAAQALLLIGARVINPPIKLGVMQKIFLVAICAGLHFIFLGPVLFTTLSDPPAALFLLLGLWGLLLSVFIPGKAKYWVVIAASLCLGCAAWIRAFYLYPVLVCVAICLSASLLNPRRRFCDLLILFALCFPGFQYYNTYTQTGKWAYFGGEYTDKWTNTHLNSPLTGYDTIFPNGGYFWRSRYCTANVGVLPNLQQHNYASLFCILANRGAFYTATYRATNYIYPDIKNRLFADTLEDIGNDNFWLRQNLDWQTNVAKAPNGNMTADKLTPQSPSAKSGAYTSQWVALPGDTDYTFSVWLWSDKPTSIQLSFARHVDDTPLAGTLATVTQEPQRFSITGRTLNAADYNVSIGSLPAASAAKIFADPSVSPSPFYAWGAQLEEGTQMTAYSGIEPIEADSIRVWHPWLLMANGAAFLIALLLIIRARNLLLYEPIGLAVTGTVIVVLAGALAIIPEQRFAIVFMVFMWLLASAQVFFWLINMLRRTIPYSPAP